LKPTPSNRFYAAINTHPIFAYAVILAAGLLGFTAGYFGQPVHECPIEVIKVQCDCSHTWGAERGGAVR